jgi:hypothetical protein
VLTPGDRAGWARITVIMDLGRCLPVSAVPLSVRKNTRSTARVSPASNASW